MQEELEATPIDARENEIEEVQQFLLSYQICLDLLNLRRHERLRSKSPDIPFICDDILIGGEAFWKSRLYEVHELISSMRNCREKVILYYHYIRSMSIEHAADLLGVSRRTGYRLHRKGLFMISFLYQKKKKSASIFSIPDPKRE